MEDLSISEKIALFKESINQSINNSGLSVDIIYFILKDFTFNIKELYDNFNDKIIEQLNQKIAESQGKIMEEEVLLQKEKAE